jgi:hypothetical protein
MKLAPEEEKAAKSNYRTIQDRQSCMSLMVYMSTHKKLNISQNRYSKYRKIQPIYCYSTAKPTDSKPPATKVTPYAIS